MVEPALTPVPPNYWRETRQPIYSALLILPFLLIYEFGLVFLRSDVINGGDAILLHLGGSILQRMGFGAGSVSVFALSIFFIGAQFHKKGSWTIRPPVLLASLFESLLYAVTLFMLLTYLIQFIPGSRSGRSELDRPKNSPEHSLTAADARLVPAAARGTSTKLVAQAGNRGEPRVGLRDFVLFCGAGVYEELVFRVLLLGLLMLVCTKLLHMEHAYAAAWSVALGAVIFSGFHHIGGEPFAVSPFLQRIFAGLYFSAIYFNRSFGIAAASHALYDILVGLNQFV
jgi:hypothetical protein